MSVHKYAPSLNWPSHFPSHVMGARRNSCKEGQSLPPPFFLHPSPIYLLPLPFPLCQTAGINCPQNFSIPLYSLLPLYTSSSSPSRPTTHHSPTSSLKIPPYPHQNKKVSVLSLVCPSPLSDLTISSPNHYDCILLIIVLYYCVLLFYCILFSPLFSLMATIF